MPISEDTIWDSKTTTIHHKDLVNLYGCTIGKNTKIATFTEIQRNVTIGKNCKIEAYAFIPTGVTIGDGVFVGPHVCFTNDKYPKAVNRDGNLLGPEDWKIYETKIEDRVSIGANSTIVCGITIGKDAQVAAGSVVTKDVPPNTLVAGNPARIIKSLAKKTLVLMTERTGSTLLTCILFNRPMDTLDPKSDDIRAPRWLETIPPKQCKLWWNNSRNVDIVGFIQKNPYPECDETYIWNPPAELHPGFYDLLGPGEWKFIYLFRDPRNNIESLLRRVGEISEEKRREIFETQCHYMKDRVNSVLKMINNPKFYLLKFEDLIQSPILTAKKIFDFMGYDIDPIPLEKIIEDHDSKHRKSSFTDNGANCNLRYASWSQEEKDLFHSYVGDGLIQLGYERDNSWLESVKLDY